MHCDEKLKNGKFASLGRQKEYQVVFKPVEFVCQCNECGETVGRIGMVWRTVKVAPRTTTVDSCTGNGRVQAVGFAATKSSSRGVVENLLN